MKLIFGSKLLKKLNPKHTKGVHALVWVGATASLVACPSFLHRIFNLSPPQEHPKTTHLAASRRAQSMSALQKKSLDEDDEFRSFELECAQHEAHRAGLVLTEWENHDLSPAPIGTYMGLGGSNGARQPVKPKLRERTQPQDAGKFRRIQSAPGIFLDHHLSFDDLSELCDDETLADEFINPAIKMKQTMQIKVEKVLEDWNDDFDEISIEEEELAIPSYMRAIQDTLKVDITNLKLFDLHIQGFIVLIQDLHLLYLDALDLQKGVSDCNSSFDQPDNSKLFDQIKVLMDLAECKENDAQDIISQWHIDVVGDIISRTGEVPEEICKMISAGQLIFGSSLMPYLVSSLNPIKNDLLTHIENLRNLLLK